MKYNVAKHIVFAQEIKKLSKRKVDNNALKEILDIGILSLEEVVALNKLTDKELKQYNKLYRKKKRYELQLFIDNLTGILKHV